MSNGAPFEAGYRVVARAEIDGRTARGGLRPGRLRLEVGSDEAHEFDEEGRLIRSEGAGRSLRTTFDLRLLESEVRGRGDGRRLRRARGSRDDLEPIVTAHEQARRFRDAATIKEATDWFDRAASWSREALERDRDHARALYQPIPVLPPDQYTSLVLQMTEGCPWDRCSFCDFYRGTPHRVRTQEEFEAHLEAVLEHLGRSVHRYRRVFLGQANALLVPAEILRRRLQSIARRLPLCPEKLPPLERRDWRREHPASIEGFYSFIDAFHRVPDPEGLRQLRENGLLRAYVGLESGSRAVLEILGKPIEMARVFELVDRLHRADVGVGVILLVGAGGRRHAAEHERRSLELLGGLGLRTPDQIYLSRLVVHEGSDYRRRAQADGLGALSPRELDEQEERLRQGLEEERSRGVVVAPYDLAQIAAWSPRP